MSERRYGPEETARILQRAAERLESPARPLGPGVGDGVTLAQLAAAAAEAGIPAESVRMAAAELETPALPVPGILGAPSRIMEDRWIGRQVAPEEFEGFVDAVREQVGVIGFSALSSRSALWSSLPPGTAAGTGRQLTVALRAGDGGSTLRIEEDLGTDLGGRLAVGGAVGVVGGLMAFGILGSIAPPLALLAPVVPVAAWGATRAWARRAYRARRAELAALAARLATRAEEPFR